MCEDGMYRPAMDASGGPDDAGRPAGEFSAWLRDARAAIRGEWDADVPCDGCTAWTQLYGRAEV